MRVGIDVGGTFTDLAAVGPAGLVVAKVPTTPHDQSEAVLAAVLASGIDPDAVQALAHGMTVATNALLERRGARSALVTTEGFRDVIEIGRQARADLYDLALHNPPPLVPRERRVTVRERMGPDGVVEPLDPVDLERAVAELRALEVESVAVCLLFGYLHPAHEAAVAAALRAALPGVEVVASHEVLPEMREYERTSATVATAYLRPRLRGYLGRLVERAEGARLPTPTVMQSSGGVIDAETAGLLAATTVLSGPAGGVVGAAHVAVASGFADALTFDMGGTSTDVAAIVEGSVATTTEAVVAGVPLRLAMTEVHTVSAGGGSIAWIDDGGRLRVGPTSAGAVPGPAAYGAGGVEPTVTDADVVLGRLPDGLVLGGSIALSRDLAAAAVARLGERLGLGLEETALGIVRVADSAMAQALRVVSVERGRDPRAGAMVAFGGAGPLHACALADDLGITTVLVPAASGVLSALGLALADTRRDHVRGLRATLDADGTAAVAAALDRLADEALADLPGATLARAVDCRYAGQGHELTVPVAEAAEAAAGFHRRHALRHGWDRPDGPVEAIAVRVTATVPTERPALAPAAVVAGPVAGPAAVPIEGATVWVGAGWAGACDATGTLVLRREGGGVSLDPIGLVVLGNALAGVAEEMGAVLVRAAFSANIKERRDSSCALFSPDGRMVAQAAHVPVHLGSMPETVAAVLARDPAPGDVFIVNDPYTGGSHLPDITLVAPIAVDGAVLALAAVRAHHADVGGMRAGSMPPGATELYQEGIVIPPVRLVRGGAVDPDLLDLLLANVRQPDERRGDLDAQLAAIHLASARLVELAARYGAATVLAAYDAMIAYAERRTREAIRALPDGTYTAQDVLEGDGVTDEDIPIRATVEIAGDAMVVDFAGTSPAVRGNVNCPLAVTRAGCLFALRVLLPGDIPMNAGVSAPLAVRAEPGSLVNARPPSAVAAGNVETSSRVADVVMAALAEVADLPAQGQGTMNNLVLGGAGWSTYETIGGGQGASSRGPGPSGVHVAMSNTRNTPVEALELEAPVRVRRYELAYGTGGAGRHPGGDGIVREVEVLAPAALSLVADRRRIGPRGAQGGGPGAVGEHRVNGAPVGAKAGVELVPGDVVRVRTPGGGGWGAPTGAAPGPSGETGGR